MQIMRGCLECADPSRERSEALQNAVVRGRGNHHDRHHCPPGLQKQARNNGWLTRWAVGVRTNSKFASVGRGERALEKGGGEQCGPSSLVSRTIIGLVDNSRSSMFGESDRSLKTSEAGGRSSSGVSGGGVALSPSVLEDDAGDFLVGDVYLAANQVSPLSTRLSSTYNVFGCLLDGADRLAKAAFSVFHPVKRVIGALGGKLDTVAAPLASDEKRAVYLCHGIVPQLLFSSEFSGRLWWGV